MTTNELEKPNTADKFIGNMADKLGAVARAATVFAEPVERDGLTVIPVAKARWGFGGGLGSTKEQHGGGGGGGVTVTPVGYIEIRNGETEFRRIRSTSLPWLLASGIALLLLREALRK